MAGADVLEGLAAVEAVRARGQVEAGVGVLEAADGADLHAADGVDGLHEAGEVDLHVVVDLHLGHLLDRPHGQLRPALRVGGVQLDRVRAVLLAGGAVGVRRHHRVAVPGQADHADPGAVRREVEQHQGVGAVAGLAAEPVRLALLLGDGVAAVGPGEQDVQAAPGLGPVLHVLERVDPLDAAVQPRHHRVPDPGGGEHRDGQGGHHAHRPAGPAAVAPPPGRDGPPTGGGTEGAGSGAGRRGHGGHLRVAGTGGGKEEAGAQHGKQI